MKKKFKNLLFVLVLLMTLILLLSIFYGVYITISNSTENRSISNDNSFRFDMIKEVNKNYKNTNYLISPYSIEVTLSMVRDGAYSTTLEELESVVPERKIEDIRIKKKINVANALFIKNDYGKNIKLDYKHKMKKNYNSKILVDKFDTPKVINDWAKKETDGMIDDVVDDISPEFVLGIANAVALDVEWNSEFECNNTKRDIFISNGKNIDVAMMSNSYRNDASYFDTDNEKGVIIPYKYYDKKSGKEDYTKNSELEFIGILPKTDINSYIDKIDGNLFKIIEKNKKKAGSDLTIGVKIPRFSYSFDYSNFKEGLMDMGLKEMFTPSADFSRITDIDIYISKAVHKTFIDLNESGTKAAAVTYFGFEKNAIDIVENDVEISFNKPFIYMIKYKNEIVFFGVVYKPEKWTSSTIACKE